MTEDWIIGKGTQKDLRRSLTPTLRKDQLHFWHDSQILAKISVLKVSRSGAPSACLVIKPVLHYISEFLVRVLFLYPIWIPFLHLSPLILALSALSYRENAFSSFSETFFFSMLEYRLVPSDSFSVHWTSSLQKSCFLILWSFLPLPSAISVLAYWLSWSRVLWAVFAIELS